MTAVVLTPNEVHLAASHAVLRRYEKLAGRRSDRQQATVSDWDNEIEGACAEVAWSKLRRQFWCGVSDIKAQDGLDAEVRWTKHAEGGLIVYAHDREDVVFVLARGHAPQYEFVGWMYGREAKHVGDPRPFGLLVPAAELHPMSERPNPTNMKGAS